MQLRTTIAAVALFALFASSIAPRVASAAAPRSVFETALPNGLSVTVDSDGMASLRGPYGAIGLRRVTDAWAVAHAADSPVAQHRIVEELLHDRRLPYRPNVVIVALRSGTATTRGTSVASAFASIGASKAERLFTHRPANALGITKPDLSDVYRIAIRGTSVPDAVRRLATEPSVELAEPEWIVTPAIARGPALPPALVRAAANAVRTPLRTQSTSSDVPTNYDVVDSGQPMLNAPGVDAIAAYDEIERQFHELPGQGEIVTNVSLGDVDDASATHRPSDPCGVYVSAYGPTTRKIGGQRYLDLPAFPLIPAYTADASGAIVNTDVCGLDPFLGEIGLDFSMMAPLPHDRQRAGETGSGLGDLLGIAPGARYRLVVPATVSDVGNVDIAGALLAAASQRPAPNVITASLGFGYDVYGYPGRYLEEDPLVRAVVSTIVNGLHIVACISANDGTRTYTTAAIGVAGGSAATLATTGQSAVTDLAGVELSVAPSRVVDTGAIDAGGSTLDDIFSANPIDPANRRLADQLAFPETRWNGFQSFSSGYGSRVDLSAPSDNVVSVEHDGSSYDSVAYTLEGGTSAAAPEVAAAAAVVLQVARLTGHPLQTPQAVRTLLESTATPLPNPPQAGVRLHVGPQIDLARAVETLLHHGAAQPSPPRIARVAVALRNPLDPYDDSSFTENTDPANISTVNYAAASSGNPNGNEVYLTIAPDWENLPAGARFRLFVAGHPSKVLSTSAHARFVLARLLQQLGLEQFSTHVQNAELTYQALAGTRVLASANVPLGFAPTAPSNAADTTLLAPIVPAVVTGDRIPVRYDIRNNFLGTNDASVVVTYPGRFNNSFPEVSAGSLVYHPFAYVARLTSAQGTVEIPVSALRGAGIYGIAILPQGGAGGCFRCFYGSETDFAIVRVARTNAMPDAPLLSTPNAAPANTLAIVHDGSFSVTYDCSRVPTATGATLEIAAPGPSIWSSYNDVNNPNGSEFDDNGRDTGSIAHLPLPGCKGTTHFKASQLGLIDGGVYAMRVFATAGAKIVGEASDASSLEVGDAVTAANGEPIAYSGFGLDGGDRRGFLIAQPAPLFSISGSSSASIDVSLERFDLDTGRITESGAPSVLLPSGTSLAYGPTDDFRLLGTYAGDAAFYQVFDLTGNASAGEYLAANASLAAPGIPWTCTLCNGGFGPLLTGFGLSSTQQAIGFNDYASRFAHYPKEVLADRSNVSANQSTAALDPAKLGKLKVPYLDATDLDATSGTGYALVNGADNGAYVASLDYGAGSAHFAFPLGRSTLAHGLQIDQKTRIAASVVQELQTFGGGPGLSPLHNAVALMNLADGTRNEARYPDAYDPAFSFVTIDSVNHLVLVADLFPWRGEQGHDMTQGSQLVVMDEHGAIQKTIDLPLIDLTLYFNGTRLFAADGRTRRLFFLCPSLACIDTVKY